METNRVEDNFHGNISTPKMKDLNKKRNDESFQFLDESWMENIQLDEHEICKSNVINECIEENKELIIHRKLRFSSLTPKKRINDSFEETELATVNQNVDDFLIGNESHSHEAIENCDDENNISEQNGNCQINVSSVIKEKLKQNAKISAQKRISNTSLIQETAIAVSLEEAEKRRNEHSQINSKGAFYGLPSQVKQLLKKHRGIEELYEWQHECLTLPAITEGKNLIYCLPMSGGKTLVAEILIFQKLLCKKQNALLILPYISIVQEKVLKEKDICYSLDAKDEHESNWLFYVNFAPEQEQQNLVVLQYNGQIYYETIKDISPDTELLVWCGDDDATVMGMKLGFEEIQSDQNSVFDKVKAGGLNKNKYSCSKPNAVKKMIANKYHKLQNIISTVGLDSNKENDLVAFLLERPPEEANIKKKDENAVRVGPWNPPPELVAVVETPKRPVVTANEIIINHPGQQVAAKTETVVTSAATCVDNRISHLEQEVEALTEVLMSIENALATCSKHSEPKVAVKLENRVSPLRPSSNCDKNCQKTHSEPASTPKA